MKEEWLETKKEFEINEKGEYVVKNVTMERKRDQILGFEKKDFWDQVIKSIGIVTIIIPLILFKCSRDADIEQQKNILQLDLFSNVLSDIQRVILLHDTTVEFKSSKKKLDIEYFSKIMMLGNDSIISNYKDLKDTINLFCLVTDANRLLDSITRHTRVLRELAKSAMISHKSQDKSKKITDSSIKARTNLLERTSSQWNARREFIYSFNSIPLKDTLYKVLTHINMYVPYIKDEASGEKLNILKIALIDSLSNRLYNLLLTDKENTRTFENELKNSIKKYYSGLNELMRNSNQFLVKKKSPF